MGRAFSCISLPNGEPESNLEKTFSFFNFSRISRIFNLTHFEKVKKTEGFLKVLGLALHLVRKCKRELGLAWLLGGGGGRLGKLWGPWEELSLTFPYQMECHAQNLEKAFSFFNFFNRNPIKTIKTVRKIKKTEGFH